MASPRAQKSILSCVGNTPLLPVTIFEDEAPRTEVYAKAEFANPGGSVKDRAALRIIEDGERTGRLLSSQVILDSSSGNTAVSYAMIGAAKGYAVHLVMPENASLERKEIVKALGAEITFSDPLEGSDGAIRLARQMYETDSTRYFFADQYNNPSNWQAHYHTTAAEIWEQTEGRVTHFVACLGTTGTFVGTSRRLKELNPNVRCFSVQPADPWHGLEGLKHLPSAIVPGIYDPQLADAGLEAPTEEAYGLGLRIAQKQGILVGHSSGAALWGVLQILDEVGDDGVVVTVFPDSGNRYLSSGLYGRSL